VLVFINRSGAIAPIGEVTADFGSPAAIGESLFSTYLLPFEVISVLLLAAMIGAIVLTRRRDQKA
jgi:NADH-quinone oxidoreductase subunit J